MADKDHKLTHARIPYFIENLRATLIGATGCDLQQSSDGTRWPCGTCVTALLSDIMPERAPEYSQHNDPIDRVNEVWRAILQIREFRRK